MRQNLLRELMLMNQPKEYGSYDYMGQPAEEKTTDEARKAIASIALDFVPGIGDVKAGQEAVMGKNLLTGESLQLWERVLSGLGALPFIPSILNMRKFKDIKHWDFDTTSLPMWDEAMKGVGSASRRFKARVAWLNPKTFLEAVAHRQASMPVEEMIDSLDRELAKKYAREMAEGAKFPVPGLSFSTWGMSHEGRHRALATQELGEEAMPVLILKERDLFKEGIE